MMDIHIIFGVSTRRSELGVAKSDTTRNPTRTRLEKIRIRVGVFTFRVGFGSGNFLPEKLGSGSG